MRTTGWSSTISARGRFGAMPDFGADCGRAVKIGAAEAR
jgi:hypothetical protein